MLKLNELTAEERELWKSTFSACIGGLSSNHNAPLMAILQEAGLWRGRDLDTTVAPKIIAGAGFIADHAVAEFRRRQPAQ